jgi:phage shock protein PspC (stress-responsive transcriptional regulator)
LYQQSGTQILIQSKNKIYKKMEKRLRRNINDKVVAGVASGLADYLGVDVTIIRIILVAGIFLPFPVVIPYLVAWAIMPQNNPNDVTIVNN